MNMLLRIILNFILIFLNFTMFKIFRAIFFYPPGSHPILIIGCEDPGGTQIFVFIIPNELQFTLLVFANKLS